MALLKIQVLGSPRVLHNEHHITFSTRKALALLIYLAIEGGMHARKTLSEFFWPDLDAEHGRAALRSTLLQLRDALEKPHAAGEHTHLLITRDTLGIDLTAQGYLDTQTLDAAWKLTRAHGHSHESLAQEPSHDLRLSLEKAAASIHGEFLADFTLRDTAAFDDWARNQREYWHVRLHQVFDRLSLFYEEAGEREQAIETVKRWLALDTLHEEGYARLMRLYIAEGNRHAALRVYETYRTLLATAQLAEPDPHILALVDHIRTTTPLPVSKQPPVPASSPPLTLLDGPLVGRTQEFSTLVECFRKAQRAAVQVVLVDGEAGMGKTRLTTDFLNWSAAQGAWALHGRALESTGRLPYQPFLQALRPYLEREPENILSERWLCELSRLFPELRERYPDLSAPTPDAEFGHTQLYEAISRFLQALAARHAVVLVLDDIQWADSASLDLLLYLVQRWKEGTAPILLLVCLRTEAVATIPQLASWRTALQRILPFVSLSLHPLTAHDTEQWLTHLERRGASQTSSQLGQRLAMHTGGNPFYLQEALKTLLEQEVIVPAHTAGGEWGIEIRAAGIEQIHTRDLISTSVRNLLRNQLDRFSSAAYRLLVASAVLGQGGTFEHLCKIAEVQEYEGLTALDEALHSRLLRQASQDQESMQEDLYVLAHDLIREVVHREAGSARQRVFHRRAFEVLQAHGAPLGDLAHQAWEAGHRDAAFHYSVEAGNEAMTVLAIRDAISYYEQACSVIGKDLFHQVLPVPAAKLQHLYIHLGRAYELIEAWEKAHVTYMSLLAYARHTHETAIECVLLNRLANLVAIQSFDHVQAKMFLRDALEVAEKSHNYVGLAETEWNLSQLADQTWESGEALLHAEKALQLAREQGLGELTARCLHELAFVHGYLGQWEEVVIYSQEGQRLYATFSRQQADQENQAAPVLWAGSSSSRVLSYRAMESNCLSILSNGKIHMGEPQAGVALARDALAIGREINNSWAQAASMLNLSLGLLEIGQWTEGLAIIQQGVAIARTLPHKLLLCYLLTMLGSVHQMLFQLDDAQAAYIEALTLSKTTTIPSYTVLSTAKLCVNSALQKDWVGAAAYAQQAMTVRDKTNALVYADFTRWYETEALLRAGAATQAQEDVQRFGKLVGVNQRYRIPYLRSLAVLSQWEENTAQAIAHLHEAQALAQTINLPGELWQILVALGELYVSSQQQELALSAFTRASLIVQELADKIEDETLKKSFLEAPQVHSIFLQH